MPPSGTTLDRLALLEQEGAQLARQLTQFDRPAMTPVSRNPRLAVTASTGTYPFRSSANNTWEIIFTDAVYVATAGVQAITSTDRQATPGDVARNIANAPYVPEGTLLNVWKDNNRSDGTACWWFEYHDTDKLLCELLGNLSMGGSVSVKWLASKGGDDSTITAEDALGTFEGSTGDKAFVRWNELNSEYWIENVQC